jgi:hypothetical protein
MAHEQDGDAPELFYGVLDGPRSVGHLVLPGRLPIGAGLAFPFALGGEAKAALVEGEDGDAALGKEGVEMRVAADVVVEAVEEDDDGLGLGICGEVCAGVELGLAGAHQPGL